MKILRRLLFSALVTTAVGGAYALTPTVGKRVNPLDSCIWEGSQWIAVKDAPVITGRIPGNARSADGASWFISDVKNRKKVKSAKWMTSGLGVFRLFVNGKPVGEEILKPGFTHYAKTKLSFTYDVTDAISRKAGAKNVFSAQVTPGWWADKIITNEGHDGMIGKKPAFRGVLEICYTDGTVEYIKTNCTDWKAAVAGPVKHASIFDGEEYDAREPQGFEKATGWETPVRFDEFKGGIFPSDGAEIYRREDLILHPVEAYVWQGVSGDNDDAYGKVNISRRYDGNEDIVIRPGETLVVDFGQNCAGVPRFTFNAKEGTQLKCCPGELLNDGNGAKSRGMDGPEGSVHRLNLRVPDSGMQMIYTFGDNKGDVTYSPECTFYGYRFMSVTADDEVTIKSVESVPVSSVSKDLERGVLTTGNQLVNQLISNTLWGLRSNYLSVPTDCPQRNERPGWTADTQVFAETGTYFADTRKFFHKWMRDMRDTQKETGGYPGVAPLAQYGASPTDMTRVGWADAGIIVPWVVWKQYNDPEIVNENWDSMEKFMNLISSTKYDHHALTADNNDYQWADWLSYEPLESCSGRKDYRDEKGNVRVRPETYDYWNYLSACYWLSNAEMMRDMAKATGRDCEKYSAMADEARSYIREKFFNPNGHFKTEILNTMQTPALFALRNNIVEGKAKEDMIKRLRENFAEHGNCLQTGFLGTSILMPTLTENGMSDIAYELLFQRKNPSWLYSVDNGATTIWERWNSYMLDSGMGPQGMNSFNHYAYGCVCEWMWETIAGIACDAENPGFSKIIMKPVPDKRLGFVKAEFDSPAGKIKSHWKYDGDTWIWEFTVPDGVTAEVTVPGENRSNEYGPGLHRIVR